MLKLADKLSLPVDVVTQTIAMLAKRRAGKSYTMRRLVEQLVHAAQQVVLIDPKGDQWGIRSAADGKGPGLPIVILGGERADVPLEAGSGEVVAKLVVEERVSALLDLSLFRKHEVATFMTGFLEALYRLKAREIYRTPMMLVIDEADAIAPQKPQKGEERMLGAAEDIVRRGGQRGIGCVLVTQRSAVLNKNVLTQAQVLVALRTIAPQDLAAMNAWIDVHGTAEQRKTLMESLPSLPTGDAWFWSPGWPTADGIFRRVHVLPIETFDSGATPKPGEQRREPKTVADVDLDALKRQMSATIEKAKADDPRELRRRIKALEDEKSKLSKSSIRPPSLPNPTVVEKPVITDAQLARVEKALERGDALVTRALGIVAHIQELNGPLKELAAAVKSVRQPGLPTPPAPRANAPRTLPQAASRTPNAPRSPSQAHSSERLPPGEKATLIAAAQYPGGLTREQASILTGYKRSSRDAYIARLIARDYVTMVNGAVVATDAGIAALGSDYEPLPTGEALQEYWLGRLPPGEKAVLEAILPQYPNSVAREALDDVTGYKRSSRDAYIARLKARQLVAVNGSGVSASAVLFEGA